MENNNFEESGSFTVVYPKIVKDTSLLAVTRLLASSLMVTPYMTVKEFLLSLSDEDLFTLMSVIDEEESEGQQDCILIAEMLAKAEGLEHGSIDEIIQRVNMLAAFLAVESLGRRKLVKVLHENMSFGDDMSAMVIVEKLPGVDYEGFKRNEE